MPEAGQGDGLAVRLEGHVEAAGIPERVAVPHHHEHQRIGIVRRPDEEGIDAAVRARREMGLLDDRAGVRVLLPRALAMRGGRLGGERQGRQKKGG